MPGERLRDMVAYFKTNDKMEIARRWKEEWASGIPSYPNAEVYEYTHVITDEEIIFVARNPAERKEFYSSPYCKNIKKLL